MIQIVRALNADNRSAKKKPTMQELHDDTLSHQRDVQNTMGFIATKLVERSKMHDYTKLGKYLPDFYNALFNQEDPTKDSEWYKMHSTVERHHIKSHVPEDVNLIDIIECICDCTAAAYARGNGQPYDVDIDGKILELAVANTVKLLQQNIEVVESEDIMQSEIE